MSRFERLALIAGFETSPSKFVALIKGRPIAASRKIEHR